MKVKETLILVFGFIVFTSISIGSSLFLDYQKLIAEFKTDVSTVNRKFTQQISSIETVLISLTGLHHASENLNQAELSSFSEEMLKAYPFIDVIVGVERIAPSEIKTFEKNMQKQGYVGLKIKTLNTKRSQVADDYYLPVNFIEPMTPVSASLLGLDIGSLAGMREVIDVAKNTGEVAASLIKTSDYFKTPSILMFKAIYFGRYPPQTEAQRALMLNGLVALKIDVNHFIEYMELPELGLKGYLENVASNKKLLNAEKFDFYFGIFVFSEVLNMYKKNYKLTLNREISFYELNKKQALILWLISMVVFSLLISFFKKRRESEDEIKYLAYYDSLTQLPNRESFKEKLQLALNDAQKNTTSGAVLFMDIDEFKRINDTLGHDVGDELLKQLSARLTNLMRQTDAVGLGAMHSSKKAAKKNIKAYELKESDVVTRLGGDEFTVLLTDVKDVNSTAVIANRILQRISQPFNLDGHEVFVTSSIGIAMFPEDGNDVDKLLKHADTAMYHAKEMGKNNFQFYMKNMSSKIEHRLKLEGKLHQAIIKNELQLYYQPQIDSATNKIVAAEALIRWNQSELGMIFPDDFIPLAEETGQIFKIGEWVINEACRQNKQWQDAGYLPIRVAVNLSCMQFVQDGLAEFINKALNESNLDPSYLELEITESIMMRNINQTISLIKKFTDMNIGVSVDDFGTGYSSLSYLKKFPLDSLKIDKSFVMDIPNDKDDMMITSAIISMAKSLKLQVIAEGVENQKQVDFLKKHKCDLMQGYYFSRPIPADEFERFLIKQSEKLVV